MLLVLMSMGAVGLAVLYRKAGAQQESTSAIGHGRPVETRASGGIALNPVHGTARIVGCAERNLCTLAHRRAARGPHSDFVIVEWVDSGESEWDWIAPLHVHHDDDEGWYVLGGVLRFRIGDEVFEAGPGSAVLAPKGTPHAYGNARRGEPARYVLVMTPQIRALVHALHEPGAGDYAAIFRAHDSELFS